MKTHYEENVIMSMVVHLKLCIECIASIMQTKDSIYHGDPVTNRPSVAPADR